MKLTAAVVLLVACGGQVEATNPPQRCSPAASSIVDEYCHDEATSHTAFQCFQEIHRVQTEPPAPDCVYSGGEYHATTMFDVYCCP